MKAVQIINPGPKSTLKINETATPKIEPNEILVKVKATALNRADLLQRAGHYPPPEGVPNIMGLEAAGVVAKAGRQVTKWKSGDQVFALLPGGGYAEYCKIPEKMALKMPQNLSFEQAAAIPETFLTAYQALHWLGKLQRGETVLIHAGASGVGTAAIQLAHQLFQARIVTTAGKQEKLNRCIELGADYAYHYKKQNFANEINNDIGPDKIDLIIDFIGAPYWEKNIDVLAYDGRLVYLAFMGGTKLPQMSLAPLLKKRLSVMGSTLRNRSEVYKVDLTKSFAEYTLELFAHQRLQPVIDSVYDWNEVEKAHQYMADNKNTGKIVLNGM